MKGNAFPGASSASIISNLCGAEKEDLEHFLLWCPAYTNVRATISELQQPYTENTQNVIGHFLFDQKDIDKKLNTVYSFWKIRQKNI